MGRRVRTARLAVAVGLALAGLALSAAPAQAVFHLMKIREIHTGAPGDYVELQMYASGQNFVAGHTITTYDSFGSEESTFTFPGNAPNGENQRTILVADPAYVFRRGGSSFPPPDFVASPGGLNVLAGSGAVCFENIDCVSYGVFGAGLPSPAGSPAAAPGGLAEGDSLERTIAPNCPTLLEQADDTNNSATDFGLAPPSPRNNTTPPTETACGPGGGGAGGVDTQITKAPKNKTKKKRVTYEFTSSTPGATFQCSENGKPFHPCTSPHKFKAKKGKNKFEVRAVDAAGNADPTPADDSFKRRKKKK